MATPEQLDELAAPTGERGRRPVRRADVGHHQGGIDMAEDAAADGENDDVVRLARRGATPKPSEIARSTPSSPTAAWLRTLRTDGARTLPAMSSRPALAATIAAACSCCVPPARWRQARRSVAGHPPDKTSPTTAGDRATDRPGQRPHTAPTTTAPPPSTGGVVGIGPAIGEVVDVGDAKPQRFYDAYLAAALADIQAWWNEEYPRLFGEPFTPLAGGIFAAYPERTSPIPGCGSAQHHATRKSATTAPSTAPTATSWPTTTASTASSTTSPRRTAPPSSPSCWRTSSATRSRAASATLDRDVPTIYTEQQADCFSGAWARRVWQGAAVGLTFADDDIRTGLIALVAVRDPVGTERARARRPRLGVRPHRRLPGGLQRRRRRRART